MISKKNSRKNKVVNQRRIFMGKILSGRLKAASLVAIVLMLVVFAASANIGSPTSKPTFMPTAAEATTRTPAVVSNKIKTKVSTVAQYERNLYLGLKNQEDKIQFSILGYKKNKFNFDNINKIIAKEPTIAYGYTGMNGSIKYTSDGKALMKIKFIYSASKDKRKKMKADTERKATAILKKIIKPKMTDLQKEKAIHDYIVRNTVYDYKNYINGTIPMEDYTDYGALVKGKAVCDGYAKAMFRLLNKAGVKCLYIVGTANDGNGSFGHAWNKVKINGKYYNVDATWDDPVYSNGKNGITYNYFNKSDAQFKLDHNWN